MISDFASESVRRSWIEDINLEVLSLWSPRRPAFEVDLFVEEPFDFEAAWQRASRLEIEEVSIRIVSLNDLIAMKHEAGRPRDLEDIEALEKLREENERSE